MFGAATGSVAIPSAGYPTRLETRTKESNMCASHGVFTKPKGVMKVKGSLLSQVGSVARRGGGALLARPRLIAVWAEQERTRWDPKDGELCSSRMKSEETLMEVRSDSDVQIDRQTWV